MPAIRLYNPKSSAPRYLNAIRVPINVTIVLTMIRAYEAIVLKSSNVECRIKCVNENKYPSYIIL